MNSQKHFQEDAGTLLWREHHHEMLDCVGHTVANKSRRHEELRLHRTRFGLAADLAATKEVDASVMCNLEEPRRQSTVVIKGVKLSIGLEECILNDVLTIHNRPGHTRAISVKAGTQVGNRFEEREIARLKWTADIEAGWIVHIDLYAARHACDTNRTESIL